MSSSPSSSTASAITTVASTVASTASSATDVAHKSGLGGGAIAGIIIAVIVFLAVLGIAAFFAVRAIKERRKNHGEYRPHYEEVHHAKNLPYLQPPAVEGLI